MSVSTPHPAQSRGGVASLWGILLRMKLETLRFLARTLRPHRHTVIGLSALAALAAVFDAAIPVIYGRALDGVIQRRGMNALAALLGAWLVLRLVTDWLRREIYKRGLAITRVTARKIDADALAHLLSLPLSFHHEYRSGEIQERINRLRNSFENFMNQGLFDLVPGVFTVVFMTIYLAYLDLRLGAANIVIVCVFALWSDALIPRLDRAWDDIEKGWRKRYGRMWDALRNIGIVKANSAEAFERRFVGKLMKNDAKLDEKLTVLFNKNAARQDIVSGVGTVVLFGIAALAITDGAISPGQLATVLGYSYLTWAMVRRYLWVRWEFTSLDVYRRKFEEMMTMPEERYGVGRTLDIQGAVDFQHVRFRYREDRPVLTDVSFQAEPGQTVAIVGESGEGKTTIVELLSRYYEPKRGRILIDGTDTREIELGSLRSQLAYVPQDLTLFHDTLRQNIRYGRLDASDREVETAAGLAALHDWIKKLPDGYKTVVGERGLKLSAGERQRVALARAFLRNPKILILDEPTSNLDASTEAVIQQSLQTLMRGRTTFIIAHRLRTVREAGNILVLQHGRIVEQGSHHELMAAGGEYRRLHDLQFRDA